MPKKKKSIPILKPHFSKLHILLICTYTHIIILIGYFCTRRQLGKLKKKHYTVDDTYKYPSFRTSNI